MSSGVQKEPETMKYSKVMCVLRFGWGRIYEEWKILLDKNNYFRDLLSIVSSHDDVICNSPTDGR